MTTLAVLTEAAHTALRAPSVFNTQPWSWRITGGTPSRPVDHDGPADQDRPADEVRRGPALELRADHARQLETVDPDGHLLLLSCGAALHHARVALAAAGIAATVDRLPDPAEPALLARITPGAPAAASPDDTRLAAAIGRRHTDRRAFGGREVPAELLDALRHAVEAEGAYLHLVRRDQIPLLAISTELAAGAETEDPDYREELVRWTSRTPWTGDGVPASTAVEPGLRRVPVRDFALDGTAGLPVGGGRDQGAAYVVLFGISNAPIDLLRGGEALSSLLLTATADGLGSAPLSDAVEVTWPRHLLRGLLANIGEPYVVVRLGYPDTDLPVPETPRRAVDQVIEVVR